jgi:Tfp pilus assembly PilM family ATPase
LDFQENKEVWPVLAKLVDELIHQIQETLTFYYSHVPDANHVTHITMCGGGSLLKKLDELLSLKLGIVAAPGNVWKNLHATKKIPVSNEVGLTFTTAIGLALRAAENPFTTHS